MHSVTATRFSRQTAPPARAADHTVTQRHDDHRDEVEENHGCHQIHFPTGLVGGTVWFSFWIVRYDPVLKGKSTHIFSPSRYSVKERQIESNVVQRCNSNTCTHSWPGVFAEPVFPVCVFEDDQLVVDEVGRRNSCRRDPDSTDGRNAAQTTPAGSEGKDDRDESVAGDDEKNKHACSC